MSFLSFRNLLIFSFLFINFFLLNAQTTAKKKTDTLEIVDLRLNFGKAVVKSRRNPDVIVLHATYFQRSDDPYSLLGCLRQFASYNVSAHYIILRTGLVVRLVDENDVASHAGVSVLPDGTTNAAVNDRSIGIEMIYRETESPSDVQIEALKLLIANIRSRRKIKILTGHSDIAPLRRSDPWNFDWSRIGGKF
ncbi:MAG: hypothetical protein RL757_290 [Bacteroidota bacterium]|jgi:N-acetyl-anhydromuramyl-L-alanine amidase AmpD